MPSQSSAILRGIPPRKSTRGRTSRGWHLGLRTAVPITHNPSRPSRARHTEIIFLLCRLLSSYRPGSEPEARDTTITFPCHGIGPRSSIMRILRHWWTINVRVGPGRGPRFNSCLSVSMARSAKIVFIFTQCYFPWVPGFPPTIRCVHVRVKVGLVMYSGTYCLHFLSYLVSSKPNLSIISFWFRLLPTFPQSN